MRKVITVTILVLAITVPFITMDFLPEIGDPNSAPNSHVSDYYIEHTMDCNSPNIVTSVIVDFRAFDTLLETTVMFLAGVCVVLILSSAPKPGRRVIPSGTARQRTRKGKPVYRSINKEVTVAIIEPVILIYAIYVLFHGEVSLGGGFQAGALIGMAYILDVMVVPGRKDIFHLKKNSAATLAGVGPFIYAFAGILTLIGGGMFLEYGSLPFAVDVLEKHSIGILIVEIGVTIGVMGTIITILTALMERVRFDDDNI